MSLHGFKYTVKWSKDFTPRTAPPADQSDLAAFTKASAATFGGLKVKYDSDSELYSFKASSVKVQIKMIKSKSWILKDSKTDKLLRHEQMHYNITALGGRDLERGLKILTAGSVSELAAERDALSAKLEDLAEEINVEYDNTILWGTDHGRREVNQEIWELHLNKLMNDPNGELKSIYYVMQR